MVFTSERQLYGPVSSSPRSPFCLSWLWKMLLVLAREPCVSLGLGRGRERGSWLSDRCSQTAPRMRWESSELQGSLITLPVLTNRSNRSWLTDYCGLHAFPEAGYIPAWEVGVLVTHEPQVSYFFKRQMCVTIHPTMLRVRLAAKKRVHPFLPTSTYFASWYFVSKPRTKVNPVVTPCISVISYTAWNTWNGILRSCFPPGKL